MIIYQFGCKKMISSEDLVYALIVTLTLKTATPFDFLYIFNLHDTPACDDLSPYHVWLQKVEQFGRIHPDKWNFESSLWPWLWRDHSSPIFSLFWFQKNHQFKRYSQILIIWALTLKTATNSFHCMTLQTTPMHHHTKFGYKRLSGSDVLWIKLDRWQWTVWFQNPPSPISLVGLKTVNFWHSVNCAG